MGGRIIRNYLIVLLIANLVKPAGVSPEYIALLILK